MLPVVIVGGNMEEMLFKALNLLFKNFEQYGIYHETEIFKVLAMTTIRDMLEMDYLGFLSDNDIRHIEKAIECIKGESCLFPIIVECC